MEPPLPAQHGRDASRPHVAPLAKSRDLADESASPAALTAVSLNLGGRNTNPLEFILDGDDSPAGAAATQARLNAQEAMVDAEFGPSALRGEERAVIHSILDEIFRDMATGRSLIEQLLRNRTWARVYDQVKR